MNDDDKDRIDFLELRLERLEKRLSLVESELTYKIDDAKSDAERDITEIRSELTSLEHKVDFP